VTLPWEAAAGLSLHIFSIFSQQARDSLGHARGFHHYLSAKPSGKAVLHVNWFEPQVNTPALKMKQLFPIIAPPFVNP